jgi:hypothetical protein
MLGIILEFYNIVTAVIAAHQVRLCATSHAADLLDREHHGHAMLASALAGSKNIVPVGRCSVPLKTVENGRGPSQRSPKITPGRSYTEVGKN